MKSQELYEHCIKRLDTDKQVFESHLLQLIKAYGKDYDAFLKILESTMLAFSQIKKKKPGYALNNTYADASLLYFFTRDLLDRVKHPPFIFEFSPYLGWTTYIMLKAIYDSGRKDVKMRSVELDTGCFQYAKKTLLSLVERVALDSLEFIHGNALDEIAKLEEQSVDLMFIDSDHSGKFAQKYIKQGVFKVCRPDAFIHVHDYLFWIEKPIPKHYQEVEVIEEYICKNEDRFKNYTIGQIFYILGGQPTQEAALKAGDSDENSVFFTDANFFIKHNFPKRYWLGGTIKDINAKGIWSYARVWLSGLALWMIPK